MPELPEVEHVRRTLEPLLLGRTVVDVRVLRRDVVVAPGDPPGGFGRARGEARSRPPRRLGPSAMLRGERFSALLRRGKQLALMTASGHGLLVHLGMTGQLLCEPSDAPPAPPARPAPTPPHTHIVWSLAPAGMDGGGNGDGGRGGRLVFRDPRRFGGVWVLPDAAALEQRWSCLGPDALTVTGPALAAALAGSRRAIKAALLDQTVVAGVGNIYADEALFLAGVHPETPAADLSEPLADALAAAVRRVLGESLAAGGSTLRDYRDGEGRAGSYQLATASTGAAASRARPAGRLWRRSPAASGRPSSAPAASLPDAAAPRAKALPNTAEFPPRIDELFTSRSAYR